MDRARRAHVRARTARRLVAVLTACLLLLVGLAWLGGRSDGSPTAALPAPSPSSPPTAPSPASTPTVSSTAPRASTSTATDGDSEPARADPVAARREALTQLLATRSAAVREGDADAFMATVAVGAEAFRAAQATLFTNLSLLEPTVWRYEYGGDGGAVPAADASRFGPGARLLRVALHYRLGGSDPVDVVRHHWVVAVQQGSRWVLAGPGDDVGEGHESDADAWDLGPVTVARGQSSLVVARSADPGRPRMRAAASYVEEADRAVRRVDAVWTGRWPERVVVVVPASQAEMARLLGQHARQVDDLDQIAAVTTGRVSGEPGPTAADRVIVNPSIYGELGALGRRVVLTHEVTHVATRASTTTKVPLWLSEGFADYIGYRGTGVTVAVAAADVLDAARDGHLPRRLPGDDDFNPASGGDIAVAYEQAWLAARMVAEAEGQARLVRLYQAASTATGDEAGEAAADAALSEVLGLDRAEFVARWRAYIKRLA